MLEASDLKKDLSPIQPPAHSPLQSKNYQRGNDTHDAMRHVNQFHQSVGDSGNITVEPPGRDDLDEEVDEKGVHANHQEELQVVAVLPDIYPPV